MTVRKHRLLDGL